MILTFDGRTVEFVLSVTALSTYHAGVRARSGEQIDLFHGGLSAVVSTVGATLRSFSFGEEPIVVPFEEDELSPYGRGQVLAPWPNRLEDGTYSFGDIRAIAPIDEPEHHNAIHGLVRWLVWRVLEREDNSVRLSCPLAPQPGYPFALDLELTYQLSGSGLTVEVVATNIDTRPLPFAIGFHPYLAAPSGVDRARLEIPAITHVVCNARGIPIASEPLAHSRYRRFGAFGGGSFTGVVIDDCFTDLARDSSGLWSATFWPDIESEACLVVSGSQGFSHLMCFSGDTLPDPARRRGLALEPMSAAPNALRSGDGLVVLAPGERFLGSFSIDRSARAFS